MGLFEGNSSPPRGNRAGFLAAFREREEWRGAAAPMFPHGDAVVPVSFDFGIV